MFLIVARNFPPDIGGMQMLMGGLSEKAKVSIRNIRREANDSLKKDLKDKKISEDESKNLEKKIQKKAQIEKYNITFYR